MDAHAIPPSRIEQRMKKLAFSYTSQANSQLSQAVLSPPVTPNYYLQGRATPCSDPSQARRKMVSSAVQDYLKSCLNSMARSIVLEKETVEHEHQSDWAVMNSAKREEVVDEHFIPSGVRAHYNGGTVGDWRRSPLMTVDSRPLHLSQPSVWEQEEYEANLVLKNKSATWTNDELSLSQPSLSDHTPDAHSATFPSTHRLHKKQLSFRNNHAIRPLPPGRSYPHPRDNLGSDGESPRTSDEDSSGSYYNALGFHRSKLRSYSMRPKRGNMRNSGVRSSARGTQRVRRPLTPDADTDRRIHSHHHVHEYSPSEPQYDDDVDVPDVDYDDEVDLPDESLLLDHVHEPVAESTPLKPLRYSRSRRSQRSNKPLLEHQPAYNSTAIIVQNRYTSRSPDITTTSNSRLPSFSIEVPTQSQTEVIPNQLPSYLSHESLDDDSVFSQLLVSKSIHNSDDALSDYSRVMTPDSMVSSSSISSNRPKSKHAEIAIMRNPRGKRGGSFYKTATSDYADRHTQFKPNILRKQRSAQNSATTTREGTPCASTPVPPDQGTEEDILSQPAFLKPPGMTLSISKHGSVVESETTDLPSSPEHFSPIGSPIHMPLLQRTHLLHSNRESGYISGSCESFAMKR